MFLRLLHVPLSCQWYSWSSTCTCAQACMLEACMYLCVVNIFHGAWSVTRQTRTSDLEAPVSCQWYIHEARFVPAYSDLTSMYLRHACTCELSILLMKRQGIDHVPVLDVSKRIIFTCFEPWRTWRETIEDQQMPFDNLEKFHGWYFWTWLRSTSQYLWADSSTWRVGTGFLWEGLPKSLTGDFTAESKHPIYEMELFLIMIAIALLGQHLPVAHVVCYLDNDAARNSLIRGAGATSLGQHLVDYRWIEHEDSAETVLCFARVPTSSNPADEVSRFCFDGVLFKNSKRSRVNLPEYLRDWGVQGRSEKQISQLHPCQTKSWLESNLASTGSVETSRIYRSKPVHLTFSFDVRIEKGCVTKIKPIKKYIILIYCICIKFWEVFFLIYDKRCESNMM